MTTTTQRDRSTPAREPDRAVAPLHLVAVETDDEILPLYRDTAIGELLASHNLGRTLPMTPSADLLIITCMDHRVTFDIPEYFAYQIRTAGATPMPVFSNVAFAVAEAGVQAICVVAHTDCAMCSVDRTGDNMAECLVQREGWHPDDARDQAILLRQVFRIDDPVRAAWSHAQRLSRHFPSCLIAPLLYRVDDGALLQIDGSSTPSVEASASRAETADPTATTRADNA